MSNVKFEIDSKDLEGIIGSLTGSEMAKAQKRALSSAGRILYKKAQQNALSMVPNVRTPSPKYNDTLYDAIRMRVYQDEDFRYYFKVHIMGTRKKGSGTFRMKFFESGTAPRKTLHPYTDSLGRTYPAGMNRGSIKGTNFFASATSGAEGTVLRAITDNLATEINKLIQK